MVLVYNSGLIIFWLIRLVGGKIALLPLQRHTSTWTKTFLSFEFFLQVPSSPSLCSFRKCAPSQLHVSSWTRSSGTAGGGFWNQHEEWQQPEEMQGALGSWEVFHARCYTQGQALQPFVPTGVWQILSRWTTFSKIKELREAQRRICNIRLK